MWPKVDAHLSILRLTNHTNSVVHIPRAIFLCVLIRLMFMIANPTIHQIYAVLDSVNNMATIRSTIIAMLMIAVLFAVSMSLMLAIFCLQKNRSAGRNAIRK